MAKVKAEPKVEKVSTEAYETALKDYVSNDNKACLLAAQRDKELLPINNKYNPKFDELRLKMEQSFETVRQYCEQNKKKLFAAAKHIEAYGANVGFRMGGDKVIILPGFDEKKIAEVMNKRQAWKDFVRTTAAMDKKALISKKPKGMEKLGFKVDKEEAFYLEPIKTEVTA